MNKIRIRNINYIKFKRAHSYVLNTAFEQEPNLNSKITLIESSDIGILGAGEGTTPHFVDFLKQLNIDTSYLFKNASATIKNGIKFTNYNGDNKSYFHGFSDNFNLDYTQSTTINNFNIPILALEKISNNQNVDNIDISNIISESKLTKFTYENKNIGDYALHFNANYLAKSLKNIGLNRNINVLDDVVVKIKTDENNYVNELILKNNVIKCDFVFDCTGFKRLIIGNFYNSIWKSYEKNLPVNRAIPFFVTLKENENIPPYTEAIAMKYGWMWKIPTQERYGCGYVFDKNCISDDEAKNEIDNYMGFEVESPRQFNFSAGTYEKIWVKNCVAIGLSSGFIEPKEATSIWLTIEQLQGILQNIDGVVYKNEISIKNYNEKNVEMTNEILDFVYLHYMTKRKDTNFWLNFSKNNIMPSSIKLYLNYCKNNIPSTTQAKLRKRLKLACASII
jgi:tryptophan halogenase